MPSFLKAIIGIPAMTEDAIGLNLLRVLKAIEVEGSVTAGAQRLHPATTDPLTLERYLALSHIAVSRHGREQVVTDALIARGAERRIALTIPHFMAAPMIILRSDLVVTVTQRLVEIFEPMGIIGRELPFPIPKLTLSIYWHEQQTTNPANQWLRSLFVELFAT